MKPSRDEDKEYRTSEIGGDVRIGEGTAGGTGGGGSGGYQEKFMSVGNQVEKPRFFVDLLQYQYEIGNVGTVSDTNWSSGEINAHTL